MIRITSIETDGGRQPMADSDLWTQPSDHMIFPQTSWLGRFQSATWRRTS